MTWSYNTLKTADAALPGFPLALDVAATTINAQTTTSAAIDLTWAAMRDVLMNNFDWGSLVQVAETAVGGTLPGGGTQTSAIQAAAMAIRECCLYGGTFNASNTTVWNRLVAAATLISGGTVGAITAASRTAIAALRTPTVNTWVPTVSAGDVQTARVQP